MLSCGPSLFRSPRPVVVGGGGGGDPYFANVVMLYHFFETAGSTTYADSSSIANNLVDSTGTQTAAGGPYGNWLRCGAGNPIALNVHDASYILGTDDFVIEFMYKVDSVGTKNMFDLRSSGAGSSLQVFYTLATGELIYFQGADRITSAAGAIANGVTYNICYQRTFGTPLGRLYIDGVSVGTWADNFDYDVASDFSVLALSSHSSSQQANCNYAEVRVTKGVTRYGASYTPAVAAFPDS